MAIILCVEGLAEEVLLRLEEELARLEAGLPPGEWLEEVGLAEGGSPLIPVLDDLSEFEPWLAEAEEVLSSVLAAALDPLPEAERGAVGLGEFDCALDDALLERLRPARVSGGRVLASVFRGVDLPPLRASFRPSPRGVLAVVEAGSPGRTLRAELPPELSAESLAELAEPVVEYALSWLPAREDHLAYGLMKLAYRRALLSLAGEGVLPWDVRVEYAVTRT